MEVEEYEGLGCVEIARVLAQHTQSYGFNPQRLEKQSMEPRIGGQGRKMRSARPSLST